MVYYLYVLHEYDSPDASAAATRDSPVPGGGLHKLLGVASLRDLLFAAPEQPSLFAVSLDLVLGFTGWWGDARSRARSPRPHSPDRRRA